MAIFTELWFLQWGRVTGRGVCSWC